MKKVLAAAKTGDRQQAEEALRLAQKKLDKAAARRYLHPNTAYRYKSRLANRVNAMSGSSPAR
jgi:small subunit ribosomal protein S20